MNIVLDTNCLIMSLSRRSPYYSVWRNFVEGNYTLCISNEILAEYEEILIKKVGYRDCVECNLSNPRPAKYQDDTGVLSSSPHHSRS